MPDMAEVEDVQLHEPLARHVFVFIRSVITRVVSGCSVCLGYPCGNHVGYDLSYSFLQPFSVTCIFGAIELSTIVRSK